MKMINLFLLLVLALFFISCGGSDNSSSTSSSKSELPAIGSNINEVNTSNMVLDNGEYSKALSR